jgi:hypothetical protein
VLRQTILKGPNSPPRDNCIIGLKLTPIMPYQCHCNTLTVPYKPLTITYSPHVLHMPWHSLWDSHWCLKPICFISRKCWEKSNYR